MNRSTIFALLLGLCCASLRATDEPSTIAALGGSFSEEFGSVKVLYWDQSRASPEEGVVGGVAINYGRPFWKNSYDNPPEFDAMTRGKIWRFGKGFWTALDTNIPLTISDREIGVGYYYLGVSRSSDGTRWSLAFIDPEKARKAHLDAFQIEQVPVDFRVPLTFAKADRQIDQLTVSLDYERSDPGQITLRIAWGKLRLTAPIRAHPKPLP